MHSQAMFFKARAREKMADPVLQDNLNKTKSKFTEARRVAIEEYQVDEGADFEALREAGRRIRSQTLVNLDQWLERFESEATQRGAVVQYARDGDEICRLIVEIARRHEVKKVVKSKSMLSEEAKLNQALSAAGIQPVETDLGEYILQINDNEPPSHIIAPAFHKSKEEVASLFEKTHGTAKKTDIEEMAREAREVLREHFLTAEMGISGGNFLIAETGSACLVTNEGNGRMVTTLPKGHIVLTGIEKVIPTLEDFSTLMRLLPRSASGQHISNYVSVLTGVKGENDLDGPTHLYFILVDNGRVGLLGTEFQEMLQCIRCGACMNHCPVYQTVGGHAYGWVYPGPMGAVLTSLYTGIANALDLPHAATMCNQCSVVCPVKIPLPALLRQLREKQVELHLRPWGERLMTRLWGWVAMRPRLYSMFTKLGVRYLNWLSGSTGRIRIFGLAPEWTIGRDLPAPEGRSFRELYAQRRKK